MGGACSAYGEWRDVYVVLVGKLEGKRPLGRPKRRWEYNIKLNLQEAGYGAQYRSRWRAVVNAVMNFRVT